MPYPVSAAVSSPRKNQEDNYIRRWILKPSDIAATNQIQLFDNSDIELLTKRQVADALRLSESMINKLIASGELPYRKIGRSVRFVRSEIMAFLNRRKISMRKKFDN